MTSTEFELLAKKFIESRLKKSKLNVPVQHNTILTSLVGNKHQIDLHYEFTVAGANYLTIIECKLWKNPVKKEKVAALNDIKNDLKAQKAIIITNTGFQKGAIDYAKTNGIALMRLCGDKNEDIAHYDGGLNEIAEMLACEPASYYGMDNLDANSFDGLFYPHELSLFKYLVEKYGRDLCQYILEQLHEPSKLDDPNFVLPGNIAAALKAVSNDWYVNYELAESAGLRLKLANEPQIRAINSMIHILKILQKKRPGISIPLV